MKRDTCQYLHSESQIEHEDKGESGNQTLAKTCRFGKKCRRMNVVTNKCQFNHECFFKARCNDKEKCKFIHHEEDVEKDKGKNNQTEYQDVIPLTTAPAKDKSTIRCRFYKNCRNKEKCEFEHPKSDKSNSKNVMEGMLEQMHSPTEEIKTIKVTMASMQIETGKK